MHRVKKGGEEALHTVENRTKLTPYQRFMILLNFLWPLMFSGGTKYYRAYKITRVHDPSIS